MMARGKTQKDKKNSGANLGFEEKLWQAADALRGSMDAAEYKHVTLGLIFLKYISDAFEEYHAKLEAERDQGADPEDPDEYRAKNIFWVPREARWSHLKANARLPKIGELVDDAMAAVERDNPSLKGVLPKDYARPALDKRRLGQLIDLITNIQVGDEDSRSKDVLGRVYEYFLGQFASAEGKKGGEFYTPRCIVRLLVEMLAPYKGRVYDPCCGSSGMFVQSEDFIEAHGSRIGDISIYGQELNYTTWRLSKMNLAIRGIDGQIAQGDTFHTDRFPDLKADYILANPPFNMSNWGGEHLKDDKRWKYGVPPNGNANFAWVQHMIYHLAPTGLAGFVLANGSMSSNQSGEGEIRKAIIEADLVDCMVALPGHLFYSMYSQVCLWFLARNKRLPNQQDHRGETLFIDARSLGQMVERTHRELTSEDIKNIVSAYHSWSRGDPHNPYRDIRGFCRSATITEIRDKGYVLTPSRYVGSEGVDDEELSSDKFCELAASLVQDIAIAKERDANTVMNLRLFGLGARPDLGPHALVHPAADNISRDVLSRRMDDTFKRILRWMFRSWFVNFDPVRAKMGVAELDVPEAIAALFPDSFEETELGEIPRGWKVGSYAEVLTPSNARIADIEAPEYSATTTGLELRELRFNKRLAKAQQKNKRIERNDLVFGLSRRVLNFGLMRDRIGSVSPVYEVFSIKTDVYVSELLELYIRYHMPMHMDILKPGAREGQPIDRDYLLSKSVLIPEMRIQQLFQQLQNGLSMDITDDMQKQVQKV